MTALLDHSPAHKSDKTETASGSLYSYTQDSNLILTQNNSEKTLFSVNATVFSKKKFAHENMKKPYPKVPHKKPPIFFSTAMSCPYGQKLKIHIRNCPEAPFLKSTL